MPDTVPFLTQSRTVIKNVPYNRAMPSETTKLTIRLPREDVDFAKSYAKAHGMSVTEIIDRHLRALRSQEQPLSPELTRIKGLIPADVNAQELYKNHLFAKHSK